VNDLFVIRITGDVAVIHLERLKPDGIQVTFEGALQSYLLLRNRHTRDICLHRSGDSWRNGRFYVIPCSFGHLYRNNTRVSQKVKDSLKKAHLL
jgi:hypothetical protein